MTRVIITIRSIICLTLCALPAVAQQAAPAPGLSRPLPATSAPIHADRYLVLLDAAHGGDDLGAAIADKTPEKSLTLAFTVRLRSELAARGVSVITTREEDTALTPDARAQAANHVAPAACISLHATTSGQGIHIFTSSLAPVAPSGRFLPWKTAQAASVTRSLKLASVLNSAFEQISPASGSADPPIPVTLGRTSLPGIDSMTCPAVAVEFAPLRNADRSIIAQVTDSRYQTRLVDSLVAALLNWRTEWQSGVSHP